MRYLNPPSQWVAAALESRYVFYFTCKANCPQGVDGAFQAYCPRSELMAFKSYCPQGVNGVVPEEAEEPGQGEVDRRQFPLD